MVVLIFLCIYGMVWIHGHEIRDLQRRVAVLEGR
jgi:hypothetical protein